MQILIADDHELFRRTVRSFIESKPEYRVCGEACDGIEAIEKVRLLRPEIVLMDINMPRMDGLEATRIIRREMPDCNVIIVTQNHATIAREQARTVDAHGSITKSDLTRDLLPTLQKVFGKAKPDAIQEVKDEVTTSDSWGRAGGALGGLVHDFDWAQTPLGPMQNWPTSLKSVVRVMLTSRFAMWMSWGPELTFLYNDAYAKMTLGKKHPWALGKPSHKVWEEIWDDIGPRIRKVLDTGQPTWDEALLLFLERSGYREETYHTFSYSALAGDDGKIAGHLCVVTEETDRVIGERRLKTLRSLAAELSKAITERDVAAAVSRSLSENQQDLPFSLTYFFSPGGHEASLACRTGITADHPAAVATIEQSARHQSWPIEELLAGKDSFTVEDLDQRFRSVPSGAWECPPTRALLLPIMAQAQNNLAGVLITGLNPYRPLDVSYAGFLNLVAGQIAASIANARAYEGEKKRAEALAEIDRAKTMFFSNVSHEFRTPLTLMLAPLEDSLAARDELPAHHRERLEIAHRNSIRLLRLVNTLLDFSRIEAGRIQASYEPTDLAELTAELASVFRSATDRAGLKLIVNCPDIDEPVYVDREMWEKIVFNLLSNAFKFTFAGEIEVSLRKCDQFVELSVRDTGTGIPEQELPHLFERFYRVKNARGRTFEGSGIGLALVQELAKLHGGRVHVQSQASSGSTFTVAIPSGSEHLPTDRIHAARTLESTGVRGEAYVQEALRWLPENRSDFQETSVSALLSSPGSVARGGSKSETSGLILLADDNADMRDYVQRLLQEEYEVSTVPDGETALRTARERRPDLILSDIMMPQMDGLQLLQAVRADEGLRSVPVILLSARAGEESRIEGLQLGADDYLVKPFSARELLARVRSHLRIAEIRREAAEMERGLRAEAESDRDRLRQEVADIKLLHGVSEHLISGENVASLYERILDVAVAIMRSEYASMQALYPDRGSSGELLLLAHRGFSAEAAKFWEWVDAYSTSTCGVALKTRERTIAADVETCPYMVGTPDQTTYLQTGIRAVQSTPLISRSGKLVGVISTHWRYPHEPSERDLRLLDILARQAADLVERTQAENVLRESEERFRALVNASSYVVYRMSPDWREMRQLEGKGFISDTGEPRTDWLQEYIHPDDREFVLNAIREAVRTKSTFELEHRVRRADGTLGWTYSRAVPLKNENGEIIEWFGAASDVTARKEVEEKYRQLADSLDAEVRDRTRGLEERNAEILKQSEQVRELSARLLQAQDEERRHIARELHDSAGQTLTVLDMNLSQLTHDIEKPTPQALKHVQTSQELVQQLHNEIRTTSYLLHPPLLEESGLAPALSWYIEGLAKRSGMEIRLEILQHFGRLAKDMELVVFRIVQECLTNIHRHSGANSAFVRLTRTKESLHLNIEDNGRGIAPEKLAEIRSGGSGVGLRGMRERVRQYRGSMTVDSNGSGTQVSVALPIAASARPDRKTASDPFQQSAGSLQ